MQHFQFIRDKRFKTFKEGLMHPGLALVAELRGTLGDFPSLGSYFFEWSTDLGVRFHGRSFGHGHYTQNDECS
jgi:hypothetical protein